MNGNFLRCKVLATVLLSLFLCVACGRTEQSHQERYAGRYSGGQPSHREPRRDRNTHAISGDFDYYVLSLSWAPTFCEGPEHRHARECDPARNTGFVIHGLWPQRENGPSPEYCGHAQQLDGPVINDALELMPDAGLVRHEWRAHGTCSGLSPMEYFAKMKKARQAIRIPAPYRSPQRGLRTSASTIEQRFAQASGITQPGVIHVHCVRDEIAEVRVCFSKSLDPRTCSENIGECRANPIFMKPVR